MSNMSLISKIAYFILKKTKPTYMDSQEEVELFLKTKKDKEFKSVFHTEYFENMKLVSFNDNSKSVILYIHGGAYVNQLNIQHLLYCLILSKLVKTSIVAPVYPLAPEHNYVESYELITKLYCELIEKYENITLMGDSAGGGFVLSFCQYLKQIKVKQPNNIIVFSPWVDLSMENCVDDGDDPILGKVGLVEIAKSWADKTDTKNYKLSPLYGDNINLPRTLIITGTDEIFYPDIKRYYKKLVNSDIDAELIEGEGLFHIYPLFPIPEAINILKKIKKEIKK